MHTQRYKLRADPSSRYPAFEFQTQPVIFFDFDKAKSKLQLSIIFLYILCEWH